VFLYGIHASALKQTGAMIPEEPMYLVLNTAISSTWGFPVPCPQDCPCDCFDARKVECACAIPPRMLDNFPNHFLIDHVRVYQAEGDDTMTVGCSPPAHPTKKFIAGHLDRYMGEDDKQPLLPVSKGGASCSSAADCGYGTCAKKACVCAEGYTGPRCLAADASDPVDWAEVEPWSLAAFHVPGALLGLGLVLVVICGLSVVYAVSEHEEVSSVLIYSNSLYIPFHLHSFITRGTYGGSKCLSCWSCREPLCDPSTCSSANENHKNKSAMRIIHTL